MKKFKKLAAALSAAIIAVSAFSVPVSVSAYTQPDTQTYEYLADDSNLAWTDGSVRVYEDGTVAYGLKKFSSVILKPAEGAEITAETLGLPDGCDVVHLDSSLYEDYDGWLRISINSGNQIEEIAALAGNWIKSGLAVEVRKLNTAECECVSGLSFSVSLNSTDDAEAFLSDYETLNFPESTTNTYMSKIFSQDEIVAAGDSYYELKADERVKSVTPIFMLCAFVHRIYGTEDIGSDIPDVSLPDTSETADVVLPEDYASAEQFYYQNAEAITFSDPSSKATFATLVLPCIDDENYGYTFEDESKFNIMSHERYIENDRNTNDDSYVKQGYDVYYVFLQPSGFAEINITAKFGKLSDTENCISKTNLSFTRQTDITYKVSDRPTTARQTIKFISENGNIKVNDDNAVVIMEGVGAIGPHECTSPYNTVTPVLTAKYEIGTDDSEYSCRRNSNGEIVFDYPCGGSIYTVYQYSLDSNEKYGLKFISAQQYNETAETPYGYVTSYNYTIEKNENGAELVSESAEEYENTPYGDVNFDSAIDIYDAIAIARYLMNPYSLNETELYAADFNRDGQNNLYDVIDIAKTIM